MIRLLVRLPVALAFGLLLVWGGILLESPAPEELLGRSLARLRGAYPEHERLGLLGLSGREGRSGEAWASLFGEERSRLLGAALLASGLNRAGVLRVLPLGLLLVAGGIAGGLCFRERLWESMGYASPTAAGLARLAMGGGILYLALYSLSPLPAPVGGVYVAFLVLTMGGALYAANLPLRV